MDFWNDYLIFCGGNMGADALPGTATQTEKAAANSARFDIVLSGTAPANYVTAEGLTVAAGTTLYWVGAVNGLMGPNQILQLDITLNTKGSINPPEIVETGELSIAVTPIGWGSVKVVNMPL
jgi:hypothetical protein